MTQQSLLLANGYPAARNLCPQLVDPNGLAPLGRLTRTHPIDQIRKLTRSITKFGFALPIVIDAGNHVVAGWGLVLAARELELKEIPAITITDLGEAELRALRLALNRLSEDSSWDHQALNFEFAEILQIDGAFDLQLTGFEMGEIDVALDSAGQDDEDAFALDAAIEPVTRSGDLWRLGDHRLYCGDALAAASYQRVLGDDKAQMVFTAPPYNVAIQGHASGLGVVKHQEFAMASGEMTPQEFERFLATFLRHAADHSTDGALHYVCIDWRHLKELMAAAAAVYTETKNLCVWTKLNAGMGSLYRSQHELIFVFKVGTAPHINNVALGRFGRHRSNVWHYAGQNDLGGAKSNKSKLALHPTAKPVALVADAMRDCSNRCDVVLDPFAGIGTTAIAAEKTGRRARLIEIEPRFVDIAVKRLETLTGRTAVKLECTAEA